MAWKRRLSADFCDYVAMHPDMWPTEEAVRTWDKSLAGDGIKNGACSSLPKGQPQSPRIIALIINYLRQPHASRVVIQQRELLHGFLSKHRRVPNPAECDPLQVIDLICEQPIATTDVIAMGMEMVGAGLLLFPNGAEGIRPCRPDELPIVVPWLYTSLGHEISGRTISNNMATQVAADHVGIGPEDYQERARRWVSQIPWSVVVVEGRKELEAVSIALPLTWSAYQEIRRGNLQSYDCSADQMIYPSEQIFVESLAMRPRFDGKPRAGTNAALARALLCQHARLTDVEGIGYAKTLRLLTRCLVPRHRVWLERFRYRLVEGLEGKFPYELHERVTQIQLSDMRTWFEIPYLTVWRLFQRLICEQGRGDSDPDSFVDIG